MREITWEEEKDLMTKVPIEVRQYIIDIIHEGESIGLCCEATNLPTAVVADVVVNNINSYDFISRKAK